MNRLGHGRRRGPPLSSSSGRTARGAASARRYRPKKWLYATAWLAS